MKTQLQQNIKQVLTCFPQYWDGDTLLKNKIIEDLRNYKTELLTALLANEVIKRTYSINVFGNLIFKVDDFISMLRYKNYWKNSYTKFSNEIGLTSDGKYLKYNTDVVLDFPHKDCVLEGGMTKEDLDRKEIYYHNVLAREEIDTMLSPKVFINTKRYDVHGIHEVESFNEKENLVIKGNNFIALHSLKERFTGKAKLIYIDPPYNTGGDSFKYNDRFNHATWLTFMKSRLEIAKELLANEGSIWINIDDDEGHYLKVLADEIFGRDNFLANIIWQKKYSPQNDAKYFSDMHDHILVFAKNKSEWKANPMPRTEEMNSRYTNRDNDPRGPWKAENFSVKTYSKDYDYEIITPGGRRVSPPKGRCWATSKANFNELVKDNRVWFGKEGNNVPAIKKFLSEVKDGMAPITTWYGENLYENEEIETFWHYSDVSHTQDAKREILALDIDFSTPKPEKLLQRIINIATNEKDLIIDFFMGSATTQAVAMKMNRQFIGIEQMDYIESVSVPRLKKVIEGEQGGISKDVNWQGGGSFIYAELYGLNQVFVSRIQSAKSDEELNPIITDMMQLAFFDYKINLDRLKNEDSGFKALPLEEKKQVLIESLDMNQMYLSYSEMDDKQYEILESVKKFNHSFYKWNVLGGEES
ncbi:cytosine methyltransferase [Bacillus pseudomycoides]|uniref:site-specific DNA-methyltransferase n=1 Tax=Bacillus wiedmannii TaxID=1890302 RepID=UPI000BEC52AE|nr:site-specific DNA-methyltransferase [Bacillus wiedmannii]PEA52830.1 cytosine methyltransferase [Bacillus pseudomycoides]PHF58767.1 cytosine methyltransferase [Bacillus wiedmannii]HDR4685916.1 site-specific DNA-methyltransferase [Bacillus cereus]